ncbi:D-2-hydroxyacid dehydrogenase family protein [Mucilaginibacter sp.]|jgi:phosphoglycerate dehydrogenase-like enzyme|uniref:D-2-hydroxyacid dehydrogenase family protein n=1 Tax=Mucilaginibacter sp. TaxID=1882438 RepID=UPI00356558B0
MEAKIRIAILDDYQDIARSIVDWSPLNDIAEITAYHDHMASESEIITSLLPYQIISVMRERMPLNGRVLEQLPNLKLVVSTGPANHSIDIKKAEQLGIAVRNTGYIPNGAPEMTWGLLLSAARNIPQESANVKSGKWQQTVGKDLAGQTIGIIGLGNIGMKVASYAKAFDMKILAWSEHLTDEAAAGAGAQKVSKEELFYQSDFITIHLPLSDRSRGIITARDIASMKPTSILINTSRGPLVNEDALIAALVNKQIAGAAIDVFDVEPLNLDHPFRSLENVIATPHLGFVTENTYRGFYQDTVEAITEWFNENNHSTKI